jgi:hypothetical protein
LTNLVPGVKETGFQGVENGLDAINIRIAVLTSDVVQSSLKFRGASPFLVVKDLALTRIGFQVTGVKIDPLLRELILLGLELEELFTAPPEKLPAEPPQPQPVVRVMPTRWAYTCVAALNQALPSASKLCRLKAPWW